MSHVYDPLSRIDVPPPRHDVESDSEEDYSDTDEEEEGMEMSSSSSSPSSSQLVVEPADLLKEATSRKYIVLVGQAGEGIAKALDLREEGRLECKGRQIASLARRDDASYLLLYPGSAAREDLSGLAQLVRALLSDLNIQSLVVVDQYNPTLYIEVESPKDATTHSSPPIRYLSSTTPSSSNQHQHQRHPSTPSPSPTPSLPIATHPFSPPNYLSHPTHTLTSLLLQSATYSHVPSETILLPSTTQQARPHTRLVKRRGRGRGGGAKKHKRLEEEFVSDDDEDQEDLQDLDEVDPHPLDVEVYFLKSQLNTNTSSDTDTETDTDSFGRQGASWSMTKFVEERRKMAIKRRVVVSGMYV